MARDDFQGQSGGGGGSYTFTVTDAYFGESDQLNAAIAEQAEKEGTEAFQPLLLHWIGTTSRESQPIMDHDGFHPTWKLASSWETQDGGKTVQYVGAKANPRLGSWYGRMIDEVLVLTEDIAETDEDPLGGEADPKVAATWIGTSWLLEDKEYEWGADSPVPKSTHLMPTEYLGKGQVPTATPVATAAPAAAANGLRAQVEALAKSLPDYATFQTAALAIPGITEDTVLLTEIATPEGIYAKVNG